MSKFVKETLDKKNYSKSINTDIEVESSYNQSVKFINVNN